MNVNNDYHYLQSKLNKSLSLGQMLILVLCSDSNRSDKSFVHAIFVNPDSGQKDDGTMVLLQTVQCRIIHKIHNLSECILSFFVFK